MAKRKDLLPAYVMWRADGENYARTPTGGEMPLYLPDCSHAERLDWGYGGSGPAQLAYCLLRHSNKNRLKSMTLHQILKEELVSRVKLNHWCVHPEGLAQWAATKWGNWKDAHPFLCVTRRSTIAAGIVLALKREQRVTIAAMCKGRDILPLVDYLADLGVTATPIIMAAILIEGQEEGCVYL